MSFSHLAAQPLVVSSYENPELETWSTNVMGTIYPHGIIEKNSKRKMCFNNNNY